MSDYRSGIVLYPEGEVTPASARQLGIVSSYREQPQDTDKGVLAVSYEPDFLRSVGYIAEFALSEYWAFDGITEKDPLFQLNRVKNEALEEARDIFKRNSSAAISEFAIPDLSTGSILDGRRMDIVVPSGTEPRMLNAYSSLFYMLNGSMNTSAFDGTVHTWTLGEGELFIANVYNSSLRLGDYRRNIDLAREGVRTVLTTSATKSNMAREVYLGQENGYSEVAKQDIDGHDLPRERIATPELLTFCHDIPGLTDEEGTIDPILDKKWRAKLN